MPDTEVKSGGSSKAAAPKKNSAAGKVFRSLKVFLAETRAEFRKIVWPTRQKTVNQTIVVLVTILVIGAVIAGVDSLTGLGMKALLKNY